MKSTNIEHDEMRFLRREAINYFLQKKPYPLCKTDNPFFLRDLKFLVRNHEMYDYGRELHAYGGK